MIDIALLIFVILVSVPLAAFMIAATVKTVQDWRNDR